ncbi:MAG: SPOR domain-containing protein [Ignavibacteria bacterium]|nr:SPOR domain-containing protein [Ignavibacteria bacterium]
MNFKYITTLFLFFLLLTHSYGQREVDITKYLDQVASGESEAVRRILPSLMKNNPQSTFLKYLQAVLTQDGRQAASLYREIVHSKSSSEYKDDAIFKLYQFHYALGEFNESDKYARMILDSYPSSSYVVRLKRTETVNRQIPATQQSETRTQSIELTQPVLSGNFTLQVGAFLDRNNAESLRMQVMKYGESWINQREVKGKIFHTVLLGKFTDEVQANILLERIKSELSLNGVVLRLQ